MRTDSTSQPSRRSALTLVIAHSGLQRCKSPLTLTASRKSLKTAQTEIKQSLSRDGNDVDLYLGWDDTSTDDKDVRPAKGGEFFDEFGHKSFMTCCERADANAVHVCIHRLLGHFSRCLHGNRIRGRVTAPAWQPNEH